MAAQNSLNREDLTGRAEGSLPFRLGAERGEAGRQCAYVWEEVFREVVKERVKTTTFFS